MPRQIYADRLAARTRARDAANQRRDRIGNLRLLVFLGVAAVVWYVFHGLAIWWILAPLAVFVLLVWWQARMERDAE